MKLNFGVVADYAYIDATTNKPYILGITRGFLVLQPIVLPRLVMVVELEATLAEAKQGASVRVSIVNQDGLLVAEVPFDVPLTLMSLGAGSPGNGLAYIVLEVTQLKLPAYGIYSCHIRDHAKHSIGSVPFFVQPPPAGHAVPSGT